MGSAQRLWHTVLNILVGVMALTAAVVSYGRTSQPDAPYFYLIGLLAWVFGLGIFISRPDNSIVRLSYLMSVGLMSVCSVDATFSVKDPGWPSKFVPLFQFTSLAFLPCIFLKCFATFPSVKRFATLRFFKWWVYAPGVLLSVAMSISYLTGNSYWKSFFIVDMPDIPLLLILNLIFVFGYSITGHACLFHTWLSGETVSQRRQAKWLLLGIGIGTIPLTFFYTTPFVFGIKLPYGGFSAYTLILIPLCYAMPLLNTGLWTLSWC